MRRLYLRVYLAVLASLAVFALLAGFLWRQLGDPGPQGFAFEVAGTLAVNALPPMDAPPAEQQRALDRLARNLRADVALYSPERARLASVGEALPPPRPGRRRSGWPGGRVNLQDEKRNTETKGIRGNLTYGDDGLNFQFGAAYDEVSRRIQAFDNSQAWQNASCGNNPNVFLPGPNSQPACQGLDAPGGTPGAGYPTYPGLGTGYSSDITTPLSYGGSLIPQTALASYLAPGPSGFVTVDWDRLVADSNYNLFHDATPETGSSNTGASGGLVDETTTGVYLQMNGDTELGPNQLRYNLGVRWVRTEQTIGGRVSIADNRNTPPAPQLPPEDGGLYPNIINFATTTNTYDNWLPSGSGAMNITDNVIVRAGLSRTMTRPNPNSMLPGLNFSTPSADVGTVGNPALDPFLSDNMDLGFEYYTSETGYFGVAAFRKVIEGFTVTGTTTVPFSALAVYGVNYDTLTPTQQAAIDARGGPGAATVVLNQQVNATGELTVDGFEFNWVQPFDSFMDSGALDGTGFTANLTIIDQKGTGAAPAVAVGVSPQTYNITAYYENYGISARLSKTYAEGSVVSGTNQNGIPLAAIYSDTYVQWDFSSSFNLAEMFNLDSPWWPELTLDVINITDEDQRSYFQFGNAAFTSYTPGRQILFGLRGSF
jgi:TonB-dependent receptor